MRIYGDEYIEIWGKIAEEDKNFIKVFFDNSENVTYIPKLYIRNKIYQERGTRQKFLIPSWFVKNQRIPHDS